jgi:hypothetical protein
MSRVDSLDETNRKVLVVLDSGEDVSSEDMVALLQRQMGRWSHTLSKASGFYREAPSESAHASLASQLEKERGKSLATDKARTYVSKLSELLELNEEQTEILLMYFLRHYLLHQVVSTKKGSQFRFGPEEDMTEIFTFYNLERVSSLKVRKK